MSGYFSDRELGPTPRTLDDLPAKAWNGIVAAFDRLRDSDIFAKAFPIQCDDGAAVCGTSVANLMYTLEAEIPDLETPLKVDRYPGVVSAMDLLEFVWIHAAKPISIRYHDYYQHHHYQFDIDAGREEWRATVNRILARNGVALELNSDGRAIRIGPPAAQVVLQDALPSTCDPELDAKLGNALRKYRDPDAAVRIEALEPMWDALERIKTILDPDKRQGVAALIESMCADEEGRAALDLEFAALTRIGNEFQIRHHDTTKTPVPAELVDYFFLRAWTLIASAALAIPPL